MQIVFIIVLVNVIVEGIDHNFKFVNNYLRSLVYISPVIFACIRLSAEVIKPAMPPRLTILYIIWAKA